MPTSSRPRLSEQAATVMPIRLVGIPYAVRETGPGVPDHVHDRYLRGPVHVGRAARLHRAPVGTALRRSACDRQLLKRGRPGLSEHRQCRAQSCPSRHGAPPVDRAIPVRTIAACWKCCIQAGCPTPPQLESGAGRSRRGYPCAAGRRRFMTADFDVVMWSRPAATLVPGMGGGATSLLRDHLDHASRVLQPW